MLARRVCNRTRPSRAHSVRAISAPLSRPAIIILQPSIFMRIAVAKVRFIARRKATRRSNCEAMFSAINCASISGRLISLMLIAMSFLNLLRRLLRILSTSSPLRPIMIPGLAVKILILVFFEARSTSIFEIEAFFKRFLTKCWMSRSSLRVSA